MKLLTPRFLIKPEPVPLSTAVEHLYDEVFGPARFKKASHQFRIGTKPVQHLCWVAVEEGRLVGAIRYWPIDIGRAAQPALLLGPLAIIPARADCGIGSALMWKTLALAKQSGHDLVLLVGDARYYARFGFVPATPFGFVMPGETRPDRLQVRALTEQARADLQDRLIHAPAMPAALTLHAVTAAARRRAS